jgi:hypothetical protein
MPPHLRRRHLLPRLSGGTLGRTRQSPRPTPLVLRQLASDQQAGKGDPPLVLQLRQPRPPPDRPRCTPQPRGRGQGPMRTLPRPPRPQDHRRAATVTYGFLCARCGNPTGRARRSKYCVPCAYEAQKEQAIARHRAKPIPCAKCGADIPWVEGKIQRRRYCETCRAVVPPHQGFRRYGISQLDFELMVEQQQGKCAICKRWLAGALSVDHDRACCSGSGSCGKCVRGLLCPACNSGLGHFGDDPDRLLAAALYLEGTRYTPMPPASRALGNVSNRPIRSDGLPWGQS